MLADENVLKRFQCNQRASARLDFKGRNSFAAFIESLVSIDPFLDPLARVIAASQSIARSKTLTINTIFIV